MALPRQRLLQIFHGEALWQLLDQGAVSGGNFLTTLLLARTLDRDHYGTFSLLFLTLFAINTCHSSLVVYPLTLAVSRSPLAHVPRLTGEALTQALTLAPFLAIVLWVATLKLHTLALLPALLLAMLFWQLQETARRSLLAHRRARAAFFPDALAYFGQAALIALLHTRNLHTIFLIVAATSALAAALQFTLLRPTLHTAFVASHFLSAWNLGRYTLAANVLTMAALQIPAWTLELTSGRASVAGYQAILNLVGIANPIIFSLSNLLIPAIARASLISTAEARQTMGRNGLRFGALLLPPFLLFTLIPGPVMHYVYGAHSPYLPFAPLLRIFTFAFIFQYAATVLGAYEGGMGRPQSYMWTQLLSTAALLTGGVYLIHRYGIAGAVYAMLLAAALRFAGFLALSRAQDKKSPTHLARLVQT